MANYALITLDLSCPLISKLSPLNGSNNVSLSTPLVFELTDVLAGVDIASLELAIIGKQAISGRVFQAGYRGKITHVGKTYGILIIKGDNWPALTSISYELHVLDTVGNELIFQGSFHTSGDYAEFTHEWVNLGEDGTAAKGQLQRFLKLVSFGLDEVKGLIDAFPIMLNVDKADADYLPMLAELVGLDFSYDIPIPRQREEIKRAVEIYKTKGSIPAIMRFCRNIIGFDPQIVEWPPRILMSNNPNQVSARITTPGVMDYTGLPEDQAFYSLDFSEAGDYRFDKFGLYFFLAEYAGIPKAAANKILRLLSGNIPASTVGRIIFVDQTYTLTADGQLPTNVHHAFGTGKESWDDQLEQPSPGQTKLINEIYRCKPGSIVYLDENGWVTTTPTNKIRVVTVLKDSEPGIDGHSIREQGLFANATAEKDSGTLLGAVNHKGQWKTSGYRIRKTIEVRL
ncbi:MAG: hypothetical protein HZA78_08005 [Candidatus Schekmanbacteria bacterium]|nr:hypothetical protein [Candidatus Schekmanbacteria bacterium]